MRTVVLQTFRTVNVPRAMQRCMESVRAWAAQQGYDYEFMGDAVFDYCGAAYLAAVGDNKRSITNLARLEWIRDRLAGGYERAIWLDADTFVFDPARFSLDVREGYACGKEVWMYLDRGFPVSFHGVHNAALVFAGLHGDLDLMIQTIRYIAATRPVEESFQVGVKLLTGLHAGLRFPLLPGVGMVGPDMIRAIVRRDASLLKRFARESGYPVRALNIAWSQVDGPMDDLLEALDILERSRGAVINRFLGHDPSQPLLVPGFGVSGHPTFRLRGAISRRLPSGLIARASRARSEVRRWVRGLLAEPRVQKG